MMDEKAAGPQGWGYQGFEVKNRRPLILDRER